MSKSIADRKKQFLEDCCGGGPTMGGGDVAYQADAPAAGPVAGYDPMLGKKKRKVTDVAKRLRKEGYVKRTESDHDNMNDAALRHDKKLRKKLNPKLEDEAGELDSGKMSGEGDVITSEIDQARNDPTGYAKEKKSEMITNRAAGFAKGKYKKFGKK